MKKLTTFFVDNSKLTLIITFFFVIGGFLGLSNLNSESYPSVNFAMATVDTYYKGASADDVEIKITKPIEDEIRTVSGLKDVRSISKSGFSSINIRIDMDNEDVEEVMSDLQKAIDRVSKLPKDLEERPSFREINSEEFPAIELAIVGKNIDRKRDILSDLLKEDLEDIKSVKNGRLVGFTEREFSIKLIQKKLDYYHIGVNEVEMKIKLRNQNIPGGNLKSSTQKSLIRVEGKITNRKDLENIVIRSNFSGQLVLLKDIATVIDGHQEYKVKSGYNGEEATLLIVNKKAGADTIKLVNEVEKKLQKYKKYEEEGLRVIIYNNEANKVRNKLEVLSSNAVSGLALVVLFLLIFLPGKIGIMASFSLPLAILATFGLMPSMGINIDTISVLALVIAIGMLVDNSVVISENFNRLKESGLESREAAIKSVEQLWLPITATAFTTIGAFMPMLVTKGIMGQFIKFIPIIVSISLLLSLFESFFLLPMRLVLAGGKKKSSETKKDWFQGFIIKFEGFMLLCVRNRYKVALVFVGTIVASFLLLAKGNKFILFPAEQTEIYVTRFETKMGTPIKHTMSVGNSIVTKIKENFDEHINHLTLRVGSSSMGPTDPKGQTGSNQGLILIYVTKESSLGLHYTDALKTLREIKEESATSLSFQELVNGPPVGEPVNVTFRSNDSTNLDKAVAIIKGNLTKVSGIVDIKDNLVLSDKEIEVILNYGQLSKLGLSVQSVGNTIRTAMQGNMASTVVLNNKEINLNIQMARFDKKKLSDLKNLKVMDSRGNLVPLSSVAKFNEKPGTPIVRRFDYKQARTITANILPKLITSQIANVKVKEIFEKISKDYPGVSIVFGGEAESTKESMQSLGQALILAMIVIFGILVFIFNSYLRPAIIMSTIPLGLVGFSIAFFFHNKPVSFMAMIGLIGLSGIIVNSGIVLISFIDQLKAEGNLALEEILVKASGMRFRAVLVTSLTTISGLFPTAYGIGGNDAMLIPMTLAMAWGLTSGTTLTLIWVPCAYGILEDFTAYFSKKKTNNQEMNSSIENSIDGKNSLA